jgi:hypothetical protein
VDADGDGFAGAAGVGEILRDPAGGVGDEAFAGPWGTLALPPFGVGLFGATGSGTLGAGRGRRKMDAR